MYYKQKCNFHEEELYKDTLKKETESSSSKTEVTQKKIKVKEFLSVRI